jgi:hypothetical protein
MIILFAQIKIKLRKENVRKKLGHTATVIWNFKTIFQLGKNLLDKENDSAGRRQLP